MQGLGQRQKCKHICLACQLYYGCCVVQSAVRLGHRPLFLFPHIIPEDLVPMQQLRDSCGIPVVEIVAQAELSTCRNISMAADARCHVTLRADWQYPDDFAAERAAVP